MQTEPIVGEVHNMGVWKQGLDLPPKKYPPPLVHGNSIPNQKYGLDAD